VTTPSRFDPERVFAPRSVAVSGAATALGRRVLANLRAAGFAGEIGTDDLRLQKPDLAIVADEAGDVPGALAHHAAAGARAAMVLNGVDNLASAAKAAGIRVWGPHSFGLVRPAIGLNVSGFPLMPDAGKVALVGQSAGLARTVIDWAVPNSVGFSQIIGIGGNADVSFSGAGGGALAAGGGDCAGFAAE
jgi:acetyltransferase